VVHTPFDGLTPTRVLWVSTTGSLKGNGSAASPFLTLQQAVDHATPGTAIMVKAGTYVGNTLIKQDLSGTSTAPIWIVSADGPQAAHLVAANNTTAVLGGGGVANIMVEGFHITGGRNGIQFSQDGFTYTKMINNIVVAGNHIDGAVEDGVKANGGTGVYVLDNTIDNGEGQQGVDFVAVNNGVIANNLIDHTTGSAAIFVKGGSTADVISGNYIHDVPGDGIGVGYHMGDIPFRPGYSAYEASGIKVTGNEITGAQGRAVVAVGAVASTISGNYLGTNGAHYTVAVNADSLVTASVAHVLYSSNLTITDNTLASAKLEFMATAGNTTGVVFQDNTVGATFTGHVGPQPVIPPSVAGLTNVSATSHAAVHAASSDAAPLHDATVDSSSELQSLMDALHTPLHGADHILF
jgi:hypothetical protein